MLSPQDLEQFTAARPFVVGVLAVILRLRETPIDIVNVRTVPTETLEKRQVPDRFFDEAEAFVAEFERRNAK